MKFTNKQISALINLGSAMANADGRVVDVESAVMGFELHQLGVTPDVVLDVYTAAAEMSNVDALTTLSAMTDDQKKYATGFLAAIMVSDGDIDDSETKLWQLICTLGDFPKMTLEEALQFWDNN